MPDAFRYCFRFCCDPGFNDQVELPKLLGFCDEAHVDDVMVFVNVEEINTGHMDEAEQDIWLDLLERIKKPLDERGITLSVNHWHSLMHADLGKHFRANQSFRAMVDPYGNAAQLCVCPLDENWRAYIARIYARYAALAPDTVWVEDDFRYHNHDPLSWGGCFCDEHMRRFSARAGKTLTREEFVAGLLSPDEPSPYRQIWLNECRAGLEGAANAIEQAVHAVNPAVKIGLMSSVPYVHAAEGRDWKSLLSAFAGARNLPVSRIHLPAYQELVPSKYLQAFHMVSLVNRALLVPETLVYPELENYPYSRFSKSRAFTRFQLLSSLALNLSGMTIDLFDLNGRGIIEQDGYQQMLREVKPVLNAMQASGVFRNPRRGVCVLVDERASYHLHTKAGSKMEELYPEEFFWAGLLPAMGVPMYVGPKPEDAQGVCAVSGQYFRNLTTKQIEKLFAENFMLLSGDALDTLLSLGLGRLAGVQSTVLMAQNIGAYTFEQVTNGKIYTGVPNARASSVISGADALDVSYLPNARITEYSALYDSFRKRRASCEVVVENRVLLYPFGRFGSPQEIPPMLLNDVRQEILQDVLATSARMNAPMVENNPNLIPYAFAGDDAMYLYLVNGAMDAVDGIPLRFPETDGSYKVSVLPSRGEKIEFTIKIEQGRCTLPLKIASMESALLTMRKQ
ncbi:MAG: hypothetical protein CVV04_13025 [Firmicutes bacterium HGW-Firmicutes-9]|jgi:hypothetical protein|nr:MAG: hypothetical protein CVV04_13025 [Firmicutes bacterium HGW-Firmicutes-9]